ncbi:MAG: hypothetical protein Ct9H300mP18_01690 [Candidatus Neomarinimicrobiota bacterium]|nr:MAG: hypothetical protein Ct9H300mP18_01690 [Candidatus Neomarinimicrobiota bacterium]
MIKFILEHKDAVVNYFGFSIVWICCASSPSLDMPYLAPIATLIFLFFHFSIIAYKRYQELQLIIFAIFLGMVVDSGFAIYSIVEYKGKVIDQFPNLSPIWILCMWAGFASQVNYAMRYLKRKYLLISFYGLLAPLAYMGGEKIKAVEIGPENINYAIIAITWSISFVLLFRVSQYLMDE